MNQLVKINDDILLRMAWSDVKTLGRSDRLRYLSGLIEVSSSRYDLSRRMGIKRSWMAKLMTKHGLSLRRFDSLLSESIIDAYYLGASCRDLMALTGASEGTVYAIGREQGWDFKAVKAVDPFDGFKVVSTMADFAAMENRAMRTGERTAYRVAA